MELADRILIVAGGLAGTAGVALSAYGVHVGGANLGTAAQFLLFHAPALLAAGLFARNRLLTLAALLLALGVALFAGDLVLRDLVGSRLFPFAAPMGGSLMMLAWLAVAGSAVAGRR